MKKRTKLLKLEKSNKLSLTILFTLIVFAVLLVSVALTAVLAYVFSKVGVFESSIETPGLIELLLFMSIVSLVVGWALLFVTMKYPLKPVNHIITQMNRLAAGDYKARLEFGKTLGEHAVFKQVSESFNTMAEELENTEMLRADFVNNFSHEFKTPIVSIAGFAKLLKRDNLTEAQKAEYIAIIEEESLRLAAMANNVLNLTKVENQLILTDISEYNLSEQIRSCVLLLENKWMNKEVELKLQFQEYNIQANEELMKEVWINLLDNAVKYTPNDGIIEVSIEEEQEEITVRVTNTGSEISKEHQDKIFNKFYQSDESHASEGNGVGLAIVKRIVDLHGGDVWAESANQITTFFVELPKIQE